MIRRHLYRFAIAVLIGALAACSDTLLQPAESVPSVPVTPAMTLHISSAADSLRVGEELTLLVTATDASGKQLSLPVTWSTQTPAVLAITSNGFPVGRVKGLSAGVATLTATVGGQAQTIGLTVIAVPGPEGSVIVIESFSVVEFQYPSQPDRWFYAPLVRVRETGNASTGAVVRMEFIIPGIGASPPCNTYRRVDRGTTLDLFREVYGDYGFTIDRAGSRATGEDATAIITVVDGAGPMITLRATGRVVPGGLPTTYTGGVVGWSCQ